MADLHLDWRALDKMLGTTEAKRAVNDLAEAVAAEARTLAPHVEGIPGRIPLPIKVSEYETDRARATVWAAHPAGLADHAKNGTLVKAASALGLEIHGD